MALFTKYNLPQIQNILARFPSVPESDFQFAGVALGTVNTFYRVVFFKGGETYYLKVDEIGDLNRLKNETLILRTLEKQARNLSFATPVPVKSNVGHDWTLFENKPVLLFKEIPGRSLFGGDLKLKHLTLVGEHLGNLHNIEIDPRIHPHRFDRSGLWGVYNAIKALLATRHPELAAWIFEKLTQLEKQEPGNLKSVLIHADLFAENMLWVKNSLSGILDFEAAGTGPALFDVAVCLHALCHDGQGFDLGRVGALLTGYKKRHPLTKGTLKLLSYFMELTAMRFLLTRLRDFELAGTDPNVAHFKDYRQFVCRFEELRTLPPFQA